MEKQYVETVEHYDLLIDEENDPVYDPPRVRDYMNKWDGEVFLDRLCLNGTETVLEIGVGTGRIAVRVADRCRAFYGIDFSKKTISRAKENLSAFENVTLINADFLTYEFDRNFDVIYSTLTFMHIKNKAAAIQKAAALLADSGRFVLGIDKDQNTEIEFGSRIVKIYPDNPEMIKRLMADAGLTITSIDETEFAYIFSAVK